MMNRRLRYAGGFKKRHRKITGATMIRVDNSRCDQCGTCISVCPSGALMLNDYPIVDHNTCTNCANCVKVCPFGALGVENGVRIG